MLQKYIQQTPYFRAQERNQLATIKDAITLAATVTSSGASSAACTATPKATTMAAVRVVSSNSNTAALAVATIIMRRNGVVASDQIANLTHVTPAMLAQLVTADSRHIARDDHITFLQNAAMAVQDAEMTDPEDLGEFALMANITTAEELGTFASMVGLNNFHDLVRFANKVGISSPSEVGRFITTVVNHTSFGRFTNTPTNLSVGDLDKKEAVTIKHIADLPRFLHKIASELIAAATSEDGTVPFTEEEALRELTNTMHILQFASHTGVVHPTDLGRFILAANLDPSIVVLFLKDNCTPTTLGRFVHRAYITQFNREIRESSRAGIKISYYGKLKNFIHSTNIKTATDFCEFINTTTLIDIELIGMLAYDFAAKNTKTPQEMAQFIAYTTRNLLGGLSDQNFARFSAFYAKMEIVMGLGKERFARFISAYYNSTPHTDDFLTFIAHFTNNAGINNPSILGELMHHIAFCRHLNTPQQLVHFAVDFTQECGKATSPLWCAEFSVYFFYTLTAGKVPNNDYVDGLVQDFAEEIGLHTNRTFIEHMQTIKSDDFSQNPSMGSDEEAY